jgi:hypothetical protein
VRQRIVICFTVRREPNKSENHWSSFFLVYLRGVRLSALGTSATVGLLYQPRMMDDDDYGAVGGLRIGRGNRSTRRKPAPVPLCTPKIPHDLTWDRTRAAAMGSQRLTAWAIARPTTGLTSNRKMHSQKTDLYFPTNERQSSVCYTLITVACRFDCYNGSELKRSHYLLFNLLHPIADSDHHSFKFCVLFEVAFYNCKSIDQPSCWEPNDCSARIRRSKSHYDRRPVGQCVLVSSPIWGSWPDTNYYVTVTLLSISGAPSDERSGLSFDLVTWTASVQCSKFAGGPRQHSISPYL